MELFEVLKLVIGGGEVALLALVLYRFATNQTRESGNQGALIGIVADLSRNIQASTETLTGIKTCIDDSQDLTIGMRREVQAAHVTQQEALTAIQTAIASLPEQTAETVQAKLQDPLEHLKQTLDRTLLELGSARLTLDQIRNGAESAEPKPDDSAPAAHEKKEEGTNQ